MNRDDFAKMCRSYLEFYESNQLATERLREQK